MNAKLRAIRNRIDRSRADAVPKGWKPATQWALEWDVSSRRAQTIVKDAVRMKLMERRAFRVMGPDYLVTVPHYREVKGK